MSVRVSDDRRVGAVLSDAQGRYDVRFEVVYGGVKELGSTSFGSLTLELAGTDAAVDKLIADLRSATDVEELA